MKKYTVLISHEFYGVCYPKIGGGLTKDRDEAIVWDTIDEAEAQAEKLEEDHNCMCDWTQFTRR
jgi:hypothetical protein